jgi:hypothetical protein
MTRQADMLQLVSDHATGLLGGVPDSRESLGLAARELAQIGLGVPVDLDDAEAFLDRLIADNTLLYIRATERGCDFADLLNVQDFGELIRELVSRLGSEEQEKVARRTPAWALESVLARMIQGGSVALPA